MLRTPKIYYYFLQFVTGSYLRHSILFKTHFNFIIPSTSVASKQHSSLLSFSPETYNHLSSPPSLPHNQPI